MSEKIVLKDVLFNKTKINLLACELTEAYPAFNKNLFIQDAISKFPQLELKARITWIAECLKNHLPNHYQTAITIIINALPSPSNPELSDGDFGDFIYAPYAEYIARYGCNKKDLALSLNALYEITQRFSAEDAIRYFINSFPNETFKKLFIWSTDKHYHVRRLASEGTRPKLPWAQKINTPITTPIPILDNLFFDSTRFVTRSVANHINDISKTDPDLAIHTLSRWKKTKQQNPKEMAYILQHSLRSLVKLGNVKALQLLGISHQAKIAISNFKVPSQVHMNTQLEFSLTLQAKEDAQIVVDYILYFQNKQGKLSNKKVFKLKKFSLMKNEKILLTKKHLLQENMTTRKIFRGQHEIEIQVNGKSYNKETFWII
jgi:3-methyladenine DNA glycosylase AlkC